MSTTTTTTTLRSTVKAVAPTGAGPQLDNGSRGKGFPVLTKPTPGVKQYTWEEVAQHNHEQSAWVYVGNRVFDITPWLNNHPGGKDILLLVAGRDVTDLIDTYHPFAQPQDKVHKVLEKFFIGELTTAEYPQFVPDRGFYAECRQKVGDYFRKNNLDPKSPFSGLWRLAIFFSLAAVTYYAMSFPANYSWITLIAAAIVFGCVQALPLLHCMHDASHLAIGSTPTTWSVIGRLCMDWYAGASLYSWLNQHTIGHHVYTNVMGADPDLPVVENGDVRRIAPFQRWASFYKYQHIYMLVLYGVLGLKFRIQDITEGMLEKKNGTLRVNMTSSEIIANLSTKVFWAFWRIFLPLFVFGVPFRTFIVLFLIAEFTTGYYLAFNFQVSHVSPEVAWPDITQPMSDEWAINQMRTSVDYAHDNPIMTFLCGALNYQTIHHLFPSVSQYHYPQISKIIMEVAKKYGIRYNYVPTFAEAFSLHVKYLKAMGGNAEFHMH